MRFFPNLLLGIVIILATLSFVPCHSIGGPQHLSAGPVTNILEASFEVVGSIIINEVMYDPAGTELDGEWVELHNPGSTPVNVSGWTVSDQEGGVDYTFPIMEFPENGYALVHVGSGQNSTEFVNGKAEFFMWRTTSLLSNAGDDILLSNSSGTTVDFMAYGPWGASSIGPVPAGFDYVHTNATAQEGFSLARLDSIFTASVPTPLHFNGDGSAPGLLVVEVHYYAWGDNEFFTVHNPLAMPVDISSWYLTDLEGTIAFPLGTVISPGNNMTVAQNAVCYRDQTMKMPDFECMESNASVPNMLIVTTMPVLANTGDEAVLRNNYGTVIDVFVYGSSAYTGIGWDSLPVPAQSQGRVSKRNHGVCFVDTNTSADWQNPRQYIIGQSDFETECVSTNGQLTVFASPDSSFQSITRIIDNATQSIWLTVYEFTSHGLADHMVQAIGRGVEVRVFLEGAPVGGITAEGLFIARRVVEAGGSVRMITNDPDNDIHARYNYVHAKYLVVDGETLIIMSENWGQSGVPLPGTAGNRGWGAAITDSKLAGYFFNVFQEDWNPERPDSVAFDQYHKLWNAGSNSTASPGPYVPMFPARAITSSSAMTPVLSPDTSLAVTTILGMLDAATERVLVEEFYIYKHWGSRATGSLEATPNLYLEAVIDAARRGCEVRVLLDATYYNSMEDDPIDNDDTVAYINSIAAAEGLDMAAKLVDSDEHDFEKIHNKGLIADDSVLISSINWNLNSVTMNRETGLIIQNAEAAEYFASIFEYDWEDDLTPPFAHFRANGTYQINTVVWLSANTSSDNSGIVNYTWRVGGGVKCHTLNFSHVFEAIGSYEIELTVRDASGNSASYSRSVNITLEAPGPDDANPDDPSNGPNMTMLAIGILLLVPIILFAIILLVAKFRKR